MLFCKKKKDEVKQELTAQEACELTIKSQESVRINRRKKILKTILYVLENGHMHYNFYNKPGGMIEEDVKYFESLGYKVETNIIKQTLMGYCIDPNSGLAKYNEIENKCFRISWDVCTKHT